MFCPKWDISITCLPFKTWVVEGGRGGKSVRAWVVDDYSETALGYSRAVVYVNSGCDRLCETCTSSSHTKSQKEGCAVVGGL